jgi:hypothetical protein
MLSNADHHKDFPELCSALKIHPRLYNWEVSPFGHTKKLRPVWRAIPRFEMCFAIRRSPLRMIDMLPKSSIPNAAELDLYIIHASKTGANLAFLPSADPSIGSTLTMCNRGTAIYTLPWGVAYSSYHLGRINNKSILVRTFSLWLEGIELKARCKPFIIWKDAIIYSRYVSSTISRFRHSVLGNLFYQIFEISC